MKKIESTIFLKNVIQFILKLGSWMLKIFTIYTYGRGGVGMVGNDINWGWWMGNYSPFSGTDGLCPNSKYDFFLNCLSEEVNTWFYPKLTEGSQETLTLKRLPPLPPTTLKSLYLEKSSLCPILKNLEFS